MIHTNSRHVVADLSDAAKLDYSEAQHELVAAVVISFTDAAAAAAADAASADG